MVRAIDFSRPCGLLNDLLIINNARNIAGEAGTTLDVMTFSQIHRDVSKPLRNMRHELLLGL